MSRLSGPNAMPKPAKATVLHTSRIERLLHEHGADHVRARTYGASVIVESGSRDEPLRHLRLRRETVHLWRLDIAGRRGRWESTPLRGNLESPITAVTRDFAWVLTPLA